MGGKKWERGQIKHRGSQLQPITFHRILSLLQPVLDPSNGNATRPALNQFMGMPELELETMFELERYCSESSSTPNNNNRDEERSNPQHFLQPTAAGHRNGSDGARTKSVELCANATSTGNEQQLNLTSGLSSLQCDVLVTVEAAQASLKSGNEQVVVVVLEDDESLFNKDVNEYQETAL